VHPNFLVPMHLQLYIGLDLPAECSRFFQIIHLGCLALSGLSLPQGYVSTRLAALLTRGGCEGSLLLRPISVEGILSSMRAPPNLSWLIGQSPVFWKLAGFGAAVFRLFGLFRQLFCYPGGAPVMAHLGQSLWLSYVEKLCAVNCLGLVEIKLHFVLWALAAELVVRVAPR
jgi:hypothetical protein